MPMQYQDTMYYKNNNDLLIKHRSLITPNKTDTEHQNDNTDVDIAKQYRDQEGTVLIEDYFADTSTESAKICITVTKSPTNGLHYRDFLKIVITVTKKSYKWATLPRLS
jgi:hypothetical protein